MAIEKRYSNITAEERKKLWEELVKNDNIKEIYISRNKNKSASVLWSIEDEVYITFVLDNYMRESEIDDYIDDNYRLFNDATTEGFTKTFMFNRTNIDMSPETCVYTREQGFIYSRE